MKTKNPVILIIRDGWGYNPQKKDNPISLSKTPNEDYYLKNYPQGLLAASGEAVGLDNGYQGNSEVGHLTLGSGRVIFQSMTRINKDISKGDFFKNKVLLELISKCKKNKTKLHLIGLLQDQGVHAHIKHLFALLDLCQKQNFKNVCLHIITDGRDAPVVESLKHLSALEKKIKSLGFGQIVTLSGRYYAMDRDRRWARTKKAYDCIVSGQGEEFENVINQVKTCHKNQETDEFIKPRKLKGYKGFVKNDGVIFFNFRTDRPRQLTSAIVEKNFKGFKRKIVPVNYVAMTQYYTPMKAKVAFPNISLNNLLGEIVSRAGLKQLRISETEKYAHVTFFFNGQKEKPNKNEKRILIHSPKVATYDLQPEMSVFKIASSLVKEIKKGVYDFIVVNLVNGDMVGHTGKISAIVKAVEAVDKAQGEIIKAALEKKYSCLILADHGNAEDKSAAFATSHTINPVPVILVSEDPKLKKAKIIKNVGLKDVAPTILKIMGLKASKEMDGKCFLEI
ncbi:MAG: 2,3-bisphosphoglycerate-independent phosphoglycerate mutase [Planctomycetes bacterium]|jgi:2,3-bisphosphoglycerate-independent phosphoglycerate mutase|nr:2,3-bisphosphoglycerate-independent phosphoglycerate mutase [Planctomycetota bacterium]